MINGAEPAKTSKRVLALIPLFLFLGCAVLKIGGAGETQAFLNPATNMIQQKSKPSKFEILTFLKSKKLKC